MVKRRRGFTIIEALASIVLLGVGVTAVLGAFSDITRAETKMREREVVTRLAQDKLDELVSTQLYLQGDQDGDFQDRGITGYSWSATNEQLTVSGLSALTVTVTKQGSNANAGRSLTTLIYSSSTTTGGQSP